MTDHDGAHHYAARLSWSGSTAGGYEAYDRGHDLSVGDHTWRGSADHAFRGDPALTNPEDLLVASASACQLLSFLAVASRARIDVVAYHDEATGVMPEGNKPMWVTRIDLRPAITVRDPDGRVTAERIAHRECFIAASLRSDIVITPTVTIIAS